MKTETLENKVQGLPSHADPETRVCRRIEIGSAIHQGDVYLHRVPDDHPRGELIGSMQVAVGDSVGSRHVVEGDARVMSGRELPEWVSFGDRQLDTAALGPVVVAPGAFTLTHPEHAHHRIPPGVYQVTYQVDLDRQSAVLD